MPCRSFVAAAWANAWLAGAAGVDDVLDAVRAWPPGGPQLVGQHVYAADEHALATLDTHEALPLPQALARLRVAGVSEFALALPAPGDPLGLAGPRTFTEDALDVGEAVVAVGADLGLIPHVIGAGVQWAASLAHPPVPESLPECDERLARAMAAATQSFTARANGSGPIDWPVDSAGQSGRAGGPDRRRLRTARLLPPNLSPRSDRVVSRAQLCQLVIERAQADPALYATTHELSAALRRALVAAVSACRAPARRAQP